MATCPKCGASIDISGRITGDRIWCSCGQWLLLSFDRNGAAYFIVVQPPVTYPREKRR
jgi:hypothetical protein